MAASIKITAALLCIAAVLPAAMSQDRGDWSAVQSLRPGARVGVVRADLERFEGRFRAASDSQIAIGARQDVTVPRDQVIRVYRKSRIGRWMRVLIGAGIGAAAGAVLNATVGQFFHNEGKDISGPLIGGGIAAGAGIGALTGSGNRTIYQRK